VNRSNNKLAVIAFSAACTLGLASCNSEKKAEKTESTAPKSTSSGDAVTSVAIEPGIAGGIVEQQFTATATVSDIEPFTRKVTLTSSDGRRGTFTAGPEIRNFDQLHVGDKVNATFTERMVVYVVGSGQEASAAYTSALATAPKGAKPGAIVSESYEVVAKVRSINTAKRTADLQFVDGDILTFPVRSDVDLSRYKVGDSVVIRITEAMSVVAKAP